MKKLLLESLQVESFETTPVHRTPSGTVRGYWEVENQFTLPRLTVDTIGTDGTIGTIGTIDTGGTFTGTSATVTGSPNSLL